MTIEFEISASPQNGNRSSLRHICGIASFLQKINLFDPRIKHNWDELAEVDRLFAEDYRKFKNKTFVFTIVYPPSHLEEEWLTGLDWLDYHIVGDEQYLAERRGTKNSSRFEPAITVYLMVRCFNPVKKYKISCSNCKNFNTIKKP